ncbi:MAG: hypothetical protein ABI868_15700 [Acidobacteriota bacterium]
MTEEATTRFLHVANGTCATRLIESAGIPGRRSIWADPLDDGPVPGGLSDGELLDVRARHLAGKSKPGEVDPVNDLRAWRAVIEHQQAYDELVLWFEHDLFDQLNLVQILTWIRDRLDAAAAVSLICIGAFPGRPGFKGLGELTAGELAPLLDTRQRVTAAQYALADQAWRAFREPSPMALDDLRQADTSALPFLAAALTRFLEEYPWTGDGLSRSERRLLQLAGDGPIGLAAAFPRMHDGEAAYYITDLSFAALVETLSRAAPPLISVAGATAGFRHASMTLTEVGRDVLTGRRDRVATCGIDRWLGGVHLQPGADLWRWDGERRRMTRD